MKCLDCCYCWIEGEDEYRRCHYPANSPFPAPCEEEEDYVEEEEEDCESPIRFEYEVYGVGKHSDAYAPMHEIVLAEDAVSARQIFELRNPNYRSTSAYKLHK